MQRVYSEFRLIFSRELQVDLFFRLYGCETCGGREASSDGGGASSVEGCPRRPTREGKALSVTSREIRWGATTPRGGGGGRDRSRR